MAMISFAFSIHNFISSVGADAGFAAIIGLAILILLYFAHARETANLREEAAMLTERLQDAETRVAQLTRTQAPASPEVGAPAPPARAAAPAMGIAPFAPAGTGAPALASATRVLPVSVSESAAEPAQPTVAPVPAIGTVAAEPAPAKPSPVAAPAAPSPAIAAAAAAASVAAAAAAPGPRAAASPAAPGPTAPASSAAPGPSPTAPAPSAAVPTADGAAASVPPATAAGGNGAGHASAGPPPVAARTDWSAPGRGTSSRPFLGDLPPLDGARRTRRSWFGRGLAVALAALAVVAAAVALVAVTSLGGSPKTGQAARTTNAPGSSPSRSAAAFKPSLVTVSVLNGTSTNQLAHRIGQKLAATGYKQGTIATAANQTESTTVVAYLPGAKNRQDAQHVAAALGLHPSAVRPIDQSTRQVACPVSTSCTSNVVVTVGADLATL